MDQKSKKGQLIRKMTPETSSQEGYDREVQPKEQFAAPGNIMMYVPKLNVGIPSVGSKRKTDWRKLIKVT